MRININLHTNQAKIYIVRGSRPQDERTKQNHVRDLRSQDSWQHVLTQTKTLSLIFMQMWFVHHLCLCSGLMKISFCFYEIFGFCVENCKYVDHLFDCLWKFQIFMKISYFYENFTCFMKFSYFYENFIFFWFFRFFCVCWFFRTNKRLLKMYLFLLRLHSTFPKVCFFAHTKRLCHRSI